MRPRRPRLFYGWKIVAVSFVTIFLALGTRYAFGVFFVAILEEYDWNRASAAGAFSLAMLVHAVFAPISGWIIDKYSPRLLFSAGAIFLGTGLLMSGGIREMWHFYLFFGVIIALGINTLSFSPHMSLIPRWFIRRRGMASGIVLAGIGMGSFILAPFVQFLIDRLGWRGAFFVLGLLILAVVLPLNALIQRKGPDSVGEHPDGDPPLQTPEADTSARAHQSIRPPRIMELVLSRNFVLLFTCNSTFGFCLNLAIVHQAAKIVDSGFDPFFAAGIVGAVGLVQSLSGIVMGSLSDRIGRKTNYIIGGTAAVAGAACLMLLELHSAAWLVYAYALLFGFGQGALPPLQAATAGDIFGGAYLGRIMALFSVGFGVGGALGAYIAGWLHDVTGSYTTAFFLLIAALAVNTVSFILTRKPGRRPA